MKNPKHDSRSGGALLMVLICAVVLGGLSLALVGVTTHSQKEHTGATEHIRALYAAEAGVAEAVAAVNTNLLDTTSAVAVQMDFGVEAAPTNFSGGAYWTSASFVPAGDVTIRSFGTTGLRTRGVEAVLVRNISPIYRNAVFAGNEDEDPAYDLDFGGAGSQGDDINGDVYSGGNVIVVDDADLDGTIRASGTISGESGEAGVTIDPPDLSIMNYETTSDVDVAAAFAGGTSTYASSSHGGNAWQMPEASPAHIFRKNPSDRTSDTSTTVKDDYFLEDPYEATNGSATIDKSAGSRITLSGKDGNPGPDGSGLVYYIDGNLWLHNRPEFSFTLYSGAGESSKVTFVVRGNIYFSDNLFYSDPDKDAVAFVAMKDPAEPDSGNIYFGDPVGGTLEYMDAFMYAENNFYDNNLSAAGSTKVTLNGNMTAGNQVLINRNYGNSYSKLTVNYDDRLATGAATLPGLPGSTPGGNAWTMAVWHEIAVP